MDFKLLLEKISNHYLKKLPFVVYSKPNSNALSALLQKDDFLHEIKELNKAGFVLSPFNYHNSSFFIPEIESEIYVSEFVKTNMPEIKIFPLEGTYLLWCDCRALRLEKSKLEEFMTEKAYIFADEGYIFGEEGTGFERLNIACSEQTVRETMDRLFKAYKRYIKK